MREHFGPSGVTKVKEKRQPSEAQRQLMGEFTELTREFIVVKATKKVQAQVDDISRDGSVLDEIKIDIKMRKKLAEMREGKFNAMAVKKMARILGESLRGEARILANEIISNDLYLKINTTYGIAEKQVTKRK